MGKFFKYLLYTLLSLALLVIIAVGVLFYTFNPNSLKGPISQQVKAQTGRDLTISGNISWKFFPWLGLTIHGVTITNGNGFAQNTNFIKLNEANIDIKVLPLFSGNIELGKIKLDGLQLNLITNAQNQNNWSDFLKPQPNSVKSTTTTRTPTTKATPTTTATTATTATTTVSNSRFKLDTIKISAVEISNAAVTYDNLKTNQKYVLKNFNLSSQNISLNSAFPITMNFTFNSTNPNISGQINLNTQIKLNQIAQSITISPFVFNAQLNGPQLPKNGLTVNLQTNLTFNKANATLNIEKLVGKIANLQFNGKIDAIDIFKNPILNGDLNIGSFNPKEFLQILGLSSPNFTNKNALMNLSLNSQFILTPGALSITNLQLGLDQSTITGQVYLALSSKNQSKFNLNIDKIDLSNYLTTNTNTNTANTTAANTINTNQATATTAATQMLPMQQLRQLNLVGNLAIDTLNFKKFQMTHVKLNINANNGLIQMAGNQANLYEGQWQSNIALNVQTNIPTWQINEVINNVQIAPLTSAFYTNTKYQISGVGNIKASITTSGNTQSALTQNLNGTGQFSLESGVINGINLGYQMDAALALVNKQTPPSQPSDNQTPFGSLTGTFKIINGLVNNNDLLLQSQALNVSGKGSINLVNQQVHYQVASTAIQGQVDPKIYNLQEKIGGSIPIKISGTLASLKVYPDIEKILTNMATAYVKQNANKVKQAVDNQVQKLGSQLQQGLQNGLNNLLK